MSQKVLFNGAVLVRPGAATKIDASGFQNVLLSGVGVVAAVGEADGGQPNVIQTWTSAAPAIKYYRSGPLAEAAQIAFQPGNDPRIGGGASLLVTVKVNQSTAASLALNGTGGITNVTGVGITSQGTPGTTNYTYAVVALLNGGTTAALGAAVASSAVGAVILTATNFNRIAWTTVAGNQGFWIYRVASGGSPSGTGFIGAVGSAATSFDDTGFIADGTTAPSVNTTGAALFLTSKDWGRHTNNISAQVSAGATSQGRIITIKFLDGGVVTTEVSPSLGDIGKFTLLYTGAGSAATCSITTGPGGALTTTVTGATPDNLNLILANFGSLADLLTAINATGKYTATALISNSGQFKPTSLDPATTVDIKTSTASFYAGKFDLLTYINSTSQLVNAAAGGAAGMPTVQGPSYLSGGFRGVTSNTNFINAIALLGTMRVNQVVALASTDGAQSENQNGNIVTDSYTALAVAAAVDAHCAFYSSTIGKSEREAWIGLHLGKAPAISEANLINDFNAVMVIQQLNLPTSAPNFPHARHRGGHVRQLPRVGHGPLAGVHARRCSARRALDLEVRARLRPRQHRRLDGAQRRERSAPQWHHRAGADSRRYSRHPVPHDVLAGQQRCLHRRVGGAGVEGHRLYLAHGAGEPLHRYARPAQQCADGRAVLEGGSRCSATAR